jgi:hypothetical protein
VDFSDGLEMERRAARIYLQEGPVKIITVSRHSMAMCTSIPFQVSVEWSGEQEQLFITL